MPSYQYRKSNCGDKTILQPSCLHSGISYTDKITFLHWIRTLDIWQSLSMAIYQMWHIVPGVSSATAHESVIICTTMRWRDHRPPLHINELIFHWSYGKVLLWGSNPATNIEISGILTETQILSPWWPNSLIHSGIIKLHCVKLLWCELYGRRRDSKWWFIQFWMLNSP